MKKFTNDIILNLFSSALPLLILQLFTLPLLANIYGGVNYGIVIVMISLITLIGFPFGNVLNNIRIINHQNYKIKNLDGDFNFLLSIISVIGFILVISISSVIIESLTIVDLGLIAFIVLLTIFREYNIVYFRVNLNYKMILLNNLLLTLGYLLGTYLFILYEIWQFIYLFGLLLSTFHLLIYTKFYKESYKKTINIYILFKAYISIYTGNLFKNLVAYSDRLFILPFLGPYYVAVYYTATIIGKIVLMIINPLNTVTLSYLVNKDKMDKKVFFKILTATFFLSLISYLMIILISPYFFSFLYPEFKEEAMKIIKFTAAAACVEMLSSIIQPYNLRFNLPKYQLYLGVLYFCSFLIFSLMLMKFYGLVGFSIGTLIAATINLFFQVLIFNNKYLKQQN